MLRVLGGCTKSSCSTALFSPQERQLAIFKIGVIEAGEDVRDAEALRYALRLLELLFVEGDVVVLSDVLERLEQVVLQVLLTLLLFNDDRALKVQIVLFLQDVKERWIGATINTNLLELVPEMILDWLLLEAVPLEDDVVLTFEYEAVDDEVFLLKKICLL